MVIHGAQRKEWKHSQLCTKDHYLQPAASSVIILHAVSKGVHQEGKESHQTDASPNQAIIQLGSMLSVSILVKQEFPWLCAEVHPVIPVLGHFFAVNTRLLALNSRWGYLRKQ